MKNNEKTLNQKKQFTISNNSESAFSPKQLGKTYLISEFSSDKKLVSDIDKKYKNLEKLFDKSNTKNEELLEELKKLRGLYDNLQKDFKILSVTNEKFKSEKCVFEKQIEENKIYIRKIESRLVQSANVQSLLDVNNKLKKEIEERKLNEEHKDKELVKLNNILIKKENEIKILNLALDIKTDNLNSVDIKSSLLFDVGICKQEMEEVKEQNEGLNQKLENLRTELKEKVEKIEELSILKDNLTEILNEVELERNNLKTINNKLELNNNSLSNQNNLLKEEIHDLKVENQNINENNSQEYNSLKTKITLLVDKIKDMESFNQKNLYDLEVVKKEKSALNQRLISAENEVNKKSNEIKENEEKNKEVSFNLLKLNDDFEKLVKENEKLRNTIEELKIKNQSLEEKNIENNKKLNNLTNSKECIQKELTKINQMLLNTQQNFNEKIESNFKEIEGLKQEKYDLRKLLDETVLRCSDLIKEKSELEKIVSQGLLKTNSNLTESHQNTQKNNFPITKTSLEKLIKMGESNLEEKKIMKFITRENEKNKEINEEIQNIKKKLKNFNLKA